jgi:hypothetical protein
MSAVGVHLEDQVGDQLAELGPRALLRSPICEALQAVVDLVGSEIRVGQGLGSADRLTDLREILLHNGSDVVGDVLAHLSERGRQQDGGGQRFLGDQQVEVFGDGHLDLVELVEEGNDGYCAGERLLKVLELLRRGESERSVDRITFTAADMHSLTAGHRLMTRHSL